MKQRISLMLLAFLLTLSLTACSAAKKDTAALAAIEKDAYTEQKPLPIEDDEPTAEMVDAPNSTCFSAVDYDEYTETLFVQFRDSGSIYSYDDVPQSVYDELSGAASMGGYYNEYIKGSYTAHRLS